ncbi:MAG: hypothetical protein AB7E60_13250 [Sphingobium sp.]
MDCQTVLSNNWWLRIGRATLRLELATPAALRLDREADAYARLREQAVQASDPETVEWAMEDLWAAGGTHWTACALLHRIIDGSYRSPW